MDTGDGDRPRRAPDRWAHRRTEPRPLAAMWLVYLIGASVVTVGVAGMRGMVDWDAYRPAVRAMLGVIGLGIGVGWPLVRLSQAVPASPARAVLADLAVMVGPVQVVVWPQGLRWMTNWPWDVVGAIALGFFAWQVLVGALLSAWLRHGAPRGGAGSWRAWAMLSFVGLGAAGPGLGLALTGSAARGAMACSPVAMPFIFAGDASTMGRTAQLMAGDWSIVVVVGAAGLAGWFLGRMAGSGAGGVRIN